VEALLQIRSHLSPGFMVGEDEIHLRKRFVFIVSKIFSEHNKIWGVPSARNQGCQMVPHLANVAKIHSSKKMANIFGNVS